MRATRMLFLSPCPVYDVAGVEQWLCTMAAEGWFFESRLLGMVSFRRDTPDAQVRYRLDAAPGSTGLLSDSASPDPEAVELSREQGWAYVETFGEYYVYRADDPDLPELNTDPQVQAIAIRKVRRRAQSAIVSNVLLLVILPLLQLRSGFFLLCFALGTPWMLLLLLLVLWLVVLGIRKAVYCRRLERHLRAGGEIEHREGSKTRATLHRFRRLALLLLCCVLAIRILVLWNESALEQRKRPLSEAPDTLPFATMADLAEGSYHFDGFMSYDGFTERHDLLAPEIIAWQEYATLRGTQYGTVRGGYLAQYFETVSPQIARATAWELLRSQRRSVFRSELEFFPLPDLGCDYAVGFTGPTHFPEIILQRDCRVIRVLFYQSGSEGEIPTAVWAERVAQSIG